MAISISDIVYSPSTGTFIVDCGTSYAVYEYDGTGYEYVSSGSKHINDKITAIESNENANIYMICGNNLYSLSLFDVAEYNFTDILENIQPESFNSKVEFKNALLKKIKQPNTKKINSFGINSIKNMICQNNFIMFEKIDGYLYITDLCDTVSFYLDCAINTIIMQDSLKLYARLNLPRSLTWTLGDRFYYCIKKLDAYTEVHIVLPLEKGPIYNTFYVDNTDDIIKMNKIDDSQYFYLISTSNIYVCDIFTSILHKIDLGNLVGKKIIPSINTNHVIIDNIIYEVNNILLIENNGIIKLCTHRDSIIAESGDILFTEDLSELLCNAFYVGGNIDIIIKNKKLEKQIENLSPYYNIKFFDESIVDIKFDTNHDMYGYISNGELFLNYATDIAVINNSLGNNDFMYKILGSNEMKIILNEDFLSYSIHNHDYPAVLLTYTNKIIKIYFGKKQTRIDYIHKLPSLEPNSITHEFNKRCAAVIDPMITTDKEKNYLKINRTDNLLHRMINYASFADPKTSITIELENDTDVAYGNGVNRYIVNLLCEEIDTKMLIHDGNKTKFNTDALKKLYDENLLYDFGKLIILMREINDTYLPIRLPFELISSMRIIETYELCMYANLLDPLAYKHIYRYLQSKKKFKSIDSGYDTPHKALKNICIGASTNEEYIKQITEGIVYFADKMVTNLDIISLDIYLSGPYEITATDLLKKLLFNDIVSSHRDKINDFILTLDQSQIKKCMKNIGGVPSLLSAYHISYLEQNSKLTYKISTCIPSVQLSHAIFDNINSVTEHLKIIFLAEDMQLAD